MFYERFHVIGGEMSALRLSSSKQSSDDHGTDVLVTNVPIRNGHIAQQNGEESLQRSEVGHKTLYVYVCNHAFLLLLCSLSCPGQLL